MKKSWEKGRERDEIGNSSISRLKGQISPVSQNFLFYFYTGPAPIELSTHRALFRKFAAAHFDEVSTAYWIRGPRNASSILDPLSTLKEENSLDTDVSFGKCLSGNLTIDRSMRRRNLRINLAVNALIRIIHFCNRGVKFSLLIVPSCPKGVSCLQDAKKTRGKRERECSE